MLDTIPHLIELYAQGSLNERCGLILRDGTIVEIENIHTEPQRGYRMNPEAVLPFITVNAVKGTWHTHPGSDPNLSQEDYAGFLQWPELTHIIVGEIGGEPVADVYVVDRGLVVKSL